MKSMLARSVAASALAIAVAATATAGPVEDTAQADEAYRTGDVVAAMALFRRAADVGHAPAQVRLAGILDAAEDDVAALELYRKAAAQDHPAGLHGVATMYAKGEGTRRDVAEAFKWYRLAAEKDHVPAIEAIAWAYLVGDLGLPVSVEEANAWGERAARLGGTRPTLGKPSPKPSRK